jgi:hypothetical protein
MTFRKSHLGQGQGNPQPCPMALGHRIRCTNCRRLYLVSKHSRSKYTFYPFSFPFVVITNLAQTYDIYRTFGGVLGIFFLQTFGRFFVGYVNSYPQGYPQGAHPEKGTSPPSPPCRPRPRLVGIHTLS